MKHLGCRPTSPWADAEFQKPIFESTSESDLDVLPTGPRCLRKPKQVGPSADRLTSLSRSVDQPKERVIEVPPVRLKDRQFSRLKSGVDLLTERVRLLQCIPIEARGGKRIQ